MYVFLVNVVTIAFRLLVLMVVTCVLMMLVNVLVVIMCFRFGHF